MEIKIVGSNSSNKIKLIKNLNKSINSMKLDFIPKIYNIIDDKKYKIKNTPALIIEDVLISEGKVLTEREISKYLKLYVN